MNPPYIFIVLLRSLELRGVTEIVSLQIMYIIIVLVRWNYGVIETRPFLSDRVLLRSQAMKNIEHYSTRNKYYTVRDTIKRIITRSGTGIVG